MTKDCERELQKVIGVDDLIDVQIGSLADEITMISDKMTDEERDR